MKQSAIAVLGLSLSLASACGDDDDVTSTGTDVITNDEVEAAADRAAYDAAFGYAMTDPLDDDFYYYDDGFLYQSSTVPSASSEATERFASRLASGASTHFRPASCVDASSTGSTATIVLDDCDTAFGPEDVSGTLIATFSEAAPLHHVHVTSSDLRIEGRAVELDIDATGRRDEDGRTLSISADATIAGDPTLVTENAEATVRWRPGSGCLAVDSSASLEIDGAEYDTELAGYAWCAGQCPSAGTLTLTAPSGATSTLTFDGSDDPELVRSDGERDTVSIECGD